MSIGGYRRWPEATWGDLQWPWMRSWVKSEGPVGWTLPTMKWSSHANPVRLRPLIGTDLPQVASLSGNTALDGQNLLKDFYTLLALYFYTLLSKSGHNSKFTIGRHFYCLLLLNIVKKRYILCVRCIYYYWLLLAGAVDVNPAILAGAVAAEAIVLVVFHRVCHTP